MAISYPLSLPSSPGVREVVWSPESAVGRTRSPYTFKPKVYSWDGQARNVTFKLPPMELVSARIWQSFILKLNGREGTFYGKDAARLRVPRGAVTDSYGGAQVKGGSQTGTSLLTDGWPVGVTALLAAGDYISIADRLYQVLDDVDSNGAGEVTFDLWPFLRSAPADNAAILVGSAARGIFRLVDWPEFVTDVALLMNGFSITAEEDL